MTLDTMLAMAFVLGLIGLFSWFAIAMSKEESCPCNKNEKGKELRHQYVAIHAKAFMRYDASSFVVTYQCQHCGDISKEHFITIAGLRRLNMDEDQINQAIYDPAGCCLSSQEEL